MLGITVLLVETWQARVRLLLRNRQYLEALASARTAEVEKANSKLQHQTAELERQAADMRRLAMSDALTGLANRRSIMAVLQQAVAAAQESDASIAVLPCDIDHFEGIDDTFGHLAGDEILTAFGIRLSAAITLPEMVGGYGGEEFLFILPGDPNIIKQRVSAVRSIITDAPYTFADTNRIITTSGGLAFLSAGDSVLSLLARADTALYEAKKNGLNRIEEERLEIIMILAYR